MNARYSDFKHRKGIGGTLAQGVTINNVGTRRDDCSGAFQRTWGLEHTSFCRKGRQNIEKHTAEEMHRPQ